LIPVMFSWQEQHEGLAPVSPVSWYGTEQFIDTVNFTGIYWRILARDWRLSYSYLDTAQGHGCDTVYCDILIL
jgi:hypothetical protein